MNVRHRYQVIVFLYQYLLVMYLLLTAVIMTGGWFRSFLFFGIGMAGGYLFVRFRMKYEIKKEQNQMKERRCHLFFLAAAVFVSFVYLVQMQADHGIQPEAACKILLSIQLFSVFAVYLYADYFHEKYLTMYANPSVSAETIRRFEKNTWRVLRKKAAVFGGIVLFLLLLASNIETTKVEQQEWQQRPQKSAEQKSSTKVVKEKKNKAKEVAEKAQRGPFWEMFGKVLLYVMKVVMILLLVLGIVGVVFLLIRKFLSIRLPSFEPVSREERVSGGNDEYTSLRPQNRRRAVFPADNNGRIRKIFYRYIRKGAKEKVDVSLTARELARQYGAGLETGMTDGEEILVALYEKARYSGKMCVDEEVERVKEVKGC